MAVDPRNRYSKPPFDSELQPFPGSSAKMNPQPDHGESSYKGSGKLTGRVALITGANSGIGRAVALAFAREGADILMSYLDEEDDAAAAARSIEEAGRQAIRLPGDISNAAHCRSLVKTAVESFGKLDILVNNDAFQATRTELDAITDDEWETTFATNTHSQFYLSKAAVPHMPPGSSIIDTASVNAKHLMPGLLAYSATKAAIANVTIGLAQMLVDKGIRVNAVLPGPIWTPFIITGMEAEQVKASAAKAPWAAPASRPNSRAPTFTWHRMTRATRPVLCCRCMGGWRFTEACGS